MASCNSKIFHKYFSRAIQRMTNFQNLFYKECSEECVEKKETQSFNKDIAVDKNDKKSVNVIYFN